MNNHPRKGTIHVITTKLKLNLNTEKTNLHESNFKLNLSNITKGNHIIFLIHLIDLSNFKHEHIAVFIKPSEINYKIQIESHYEKSSSVNPTHKPIVFIIEIGKFYPITSPRLTCQSNFVFPSMFDNRNFIQEISGFSLHYNSFSSVIIKDIPELIRYYLQNVSNAIYSFIGEYKLNFKYSINDFVLNYHNTMFKIRLNDSTYFVVLTDLALIFFNPGETLLTEKCTCEMILELKDLRELCIIEEDNITVTLKIEINNKKNGSMSSNNSVRLAEYFDKAIIVFSMEKYILFESKVNHRIALIKKLFSFYQKEKITIATIPIKKYSGEGIEEIVHYKEGLFEKYSANISSSDPKITEEIKVKERRNKEIIQKDLIDLYQKAIELYSTENTVKFNQYVYKLKQILNIIK